MKKTFILKSIISLFQTNFNGLKMFFLGFDTCCPPTIKKVSAFFNHPKFQHFKLVLGFFLFKFVLQTLDMVTDVVTAIDFFNNNHFNWGCCTIGLVFLPLGARIIQIIIRWATCYKITKTSAFPFFGSIKNEARLKILSQEMPNYLWNFPLFQPIRQVQKMCNSHKRIFW
jgi:hypothetical protein